MIETLVEMTGTPIPAVMALRARYAGNRHAYAVDKIRRQQHRMGLFKRPSMGDRMDNAQRRRDWPKGSLAEGMAMQEAAQYEQDVRVAKHKAEQKKPYRGSKAEASHRRGRSK
jgi:hypothetical protein